MLKRAFDILVSFVALAILWPFLLILGIAVRASSPGPAFFRQERVGLRGRPFMILKFRSMRTDQPSGAPLVTARDDPRITPVGRILRNTKLDELPQLINVLVGEMSFVGPRPEVAKYVHFYSPSDRELILSVRPGITDRAAIEFRDEEAILAAHADREKAYVEEVLPKKLPYYRAYAREHGFVTDLAIILKTLSALVLAPSRPETPRGL